MAAVLGLTGGVVGAVEPRTGGSSATVPARASVTARPNLTSALPWRSSPQLSGPQAAADTSATATNPAAAGSSAQLRPANQQPSVAIEAQTEAPPSPLRPMGPNASLPASPLRPPTTAQVSPPNAVRPALDQATGAVVPASATERAYEFAPESPLRPGVQNRRPATQTGTVREAPPARIQRAVYQQQPGGALALPPNDLESNRVLPPAGNPQLPEAPAVDPQAPRIPGADAFIPRDTPPAAPFGEPQQPPQVAPNDPPAVEPRVPSPSDLRGRGSMSNPFRTDDTPPATEPELNNAAPRPIPQQPNADVEPSDTELPAPARSKLSCDVLRDAVRNRTIDKISLDISPPFRPDIINRPEEKERLRKSFLQQQKSRVWRDLNGQAIGEGILVDIEYYDLVIRDASGNAKRIPYSAIGEADLAYVSEAWGLPRQCRLEQEEYVGRNFTPMTFTWKASGLCHKPLYFEEVQLERYGHSTGPFLQPVLSSAHFFVNIAVLPYKMGIHPLNECQYTLGYYRPGNCAPWMIPPVPLSLRGAIAQGAVVGGGIVLIP